MCCLFGMLDSENRFSGKEKSGMISILAAACEARGTDAAGIAYPYDGRLCIYKRPLPAHKLHPRIPNGTRVVMGHTRLTTQGSEKHNYNNHPFPGRAGDTSFALAHNGVLYNDRALRRTHRLPGTRIETDSYIAVQLLEQKRALDFSSLKYMAEQVEGSFAFTVLDDRENLYFVKGDNPLCLYHFPRTGVYLYASTEEILKCALTRLRLRLGPHERIRLEAGDILRINAGGVPMRSDFRFVCDYTPWCFKGLYSPQKSSRSGLCTPEQEYLGELKAVASSFGYAPEDIDALLLRGFSTDELEEFLYCGEL